MMIDEEFPCVTECGVSGTNRNDIDDQDLSDHKTRKQSSNFLFWTQGVGTQDVECMYSYLWCA